RRVPDPQAHDHGRRPDPRRLDRLNVVAGRAELLAGVDAELAVDHLRVVLDGDLGELELALAVDPQELVLAGDEAQGPGLGGEDVYGELGVYTGEKLG